MTAGATGDGSASAPFGRIQDALAAAQPGDEVVVDPGTYAEALRSVRAGTDTARILVRGRDRTPAARPMVTTPGNVLYVSHAFLTFEDMVFDGQYGAGDAVNVRGEGHALHLRRVEVRRSGRDCIDIGSQHDILIEASLVSHCLNGTNTARRDAHGIVAAAARRLTVRDTEIHTFSGDGIQLDPDRLPPGWTDLTIERVAIWLAPLPAAEAGYAAGTVPGENGLDTKVGTEGERARLVVRDSVFRGFRGGLVSNMAALNLKERVDAVIDGVTVSDSEHAFRVRGPETTGARVTLSNAVVYDVATAVRYEDNVAGPTVVHATFGRGVARAFQRASSPASVPDIRNLLVLGAGLPDEARGRSSNLAVTAEAFADAQANDYRLRAGSAAIDRAEPVGVATTDRRGVKRPQGAGPDVGAFEFCPTPCEAPTAPRHVRISH
ncbi:MAG: hypothetical protein KJ061_12525 [Vicinamibacteraceae bacterium]|nr:hypothetical protein [Vicinamibacteraceae bacterium]